MHIVTQSYNVLSPKVCTHVYICMPEFVFCSWNRLHLFEGPLDGNTFSLENIKHVAEEDGGDMEWCDVKSVICIKLNDKTTDSELMS